MNPNDLFNDIKAIKASLDELRQRDAPVTAKEFADINKRPINLDPERFARFALDALAAKLPDTEHIKAATDASVTAITQAGSETAEHIRRTGTTTASQIERASRNKANELATYIGFSSWRSAVLVFGGFLILVVGAMLANQQRETALAQARAETQAVREFTDWVKTQPEGKRLYDRYYNP